MIMDDQQIEQEIQANGANVAPRITPADIEASIASEVYFTAEHGVEGAMSRLELHARHPGQTGTWSQVTFCLVALRNGTKIVGINYGSVDPALHSAEVGRKYARDHAIEQIWPLLGYELRNKLHAMQEPRTADAEPSGLQPIETAPTDGTVFLGYRDGVWGDCYRVQRKDCEMWSFRGSSGDAEFFPCCKPTHWIPLPKGPADVR